MFSSMKNGLERPTTLSLICCCCCNKIKLAILPQCVLVKNNLSTTFASSVSWLIGTNVTCNIKKENRKQCPNGVGFHYFVTLSF